MHGKKAIIKSLQVIVSKTLIPPIRIFNFSKQINYMVRFSEIVLYIVVLGVNPKFLKLVLKCA